MTTTLPDVQDAYDRGRADQVDDCAQHNLDRIADVLDVIDRHAGDVEKLRTGILEAMGHGGAR
jgi:hypothetical protein